MQEDLSRFIRAAKKYQWPTREERKALESAQIRLARADFYSETPTLEEIEHSFEYARRIKDPTPPIFDDPEVFNLEAIEAFASRLRPLTAEFDPPVDAETGFFWKNGQFSFTDAAALYGIVRLLRPPVVLEIGSGFSSYVTAAALAKNGAGRLICVDPNPRIDVVGTGAEHMQCQVQDLTLEAALDIVGPGDIVFYDGSHALKTGSDCVYFYLKLLPYLPRGVVVQSHDIRLPYPQPPELLIDHKLNWSEQYLLMAHLYNRNRYRVLFASYLLFRRSPEVLDALMHNKWAGGGASIWYEVI